MELFEKADNGADEERPKGVCSIRMVVRRFAPSNHADAPHPPRYLKFVENWIETMEDGKAKDVEWVFFTGFEGQIPSQEEALSIIQSDTEIKQSKEKFGVSMDALLVSMPPTRKELVFLIGALVTGWGNTLGHEVDLGKITYRIVGNYLMVTVWK